MISATIAIKELIVSTLPFSCYTGTWSPLWGTTCSSGILEAEIGWFLFRFQAHWVLFRAWKYKRIIFLCLINHLHWVFCYSSTERD